MKKSQKTTATTSTGRPTRRNYTEGDKDSAIQSLNMERQDVSISHAAHAYLCDFTDLLLWRYVPSITFEGDLNILRDKYHMTRGYGCVLRIGKINGIHYVEK